MSDGATLGKRRSYPRNGVPLQAPAFAPQSVCERLIATTKAQHGLSVSARLRRGGRGGFRRALVACSRIDRESVQQAKKRVSLFDLVQPHVRSSRPSGPNRYMCLCPFHDERTASMLVDDERGYFHCFGCGASGDAIRFLMNIHKTDFHAAAKTLLSYVKDNKEIVSTSPLQASETRHAKDAVQHVPFVNAGVDAIAPKELSMQSAVQERVLHMNSLALKFFRRQLKDLQSRPEHLSPEARRLFRYLCERRGFSPRTIDTFRIGYAPAGWRELVDYMLYEQTELAVTGEDLVLAGLAKVRPLPQDKEKLGIRTPSQGLYDVFRDRIMIPILDAEGRVVGFGGRRLESREPDPAEAVLVLPPAENGSSGSHGHGAASLPGPSISMVGTSSSMFSTASGSTAMRDADSYLTQVQLRAVTAPTQEEAFTGPKYVNTPETPVFQKARILFGMSETLRRVRFPEEFADDWRLADAFGPCVVLVEGYLDVLRLHQEGIWFAVASLGTSVTSAQCEMLVELVRLIENEHVLRSSKRLRPRLILQLDQDEAGSRATKRTIGMFLDKYQRYGERFGLHLCVAQLPSHVKDADEYIQAYGSEAYLRQVVTQAQVWWRHEITSRLDTYVRAVEASRQCIKAEEDVTRLFWCRSPALNACLEDIANCIRMAQLKSKEYHVVTVQVAQRIAGLFVPFHHLEDPYRELVAEIKRRVQQRPVHVPHHNAVTQVNGALVQSTATPAMGTGAPYYKLQARDGTNISPAWRGTAPAVPASYIPPPYGDYPPWIWAEIKLLRIVVCATAAQRESWRQRLQEESIPLLMLITVPTIRRAIAFLLGLSTDRTGRSESNGSVFPMDDIVAVTDALIDRGIIEECDLDATDAPVEDHRHRHPLDRQQGHQYPLDAYRIPKEVFGPIDGNSSATLTPRRAPSATPAAAPERTASAGSNPSWRLNGSASSAANPLGNGVSTGDITASGRGVHKDEADPNAAANSTETPASSSSANPMLNGTSKSLGPGAQVSLAKPPCMRTNPAFADSDSFASRTARIITRTIRSIGVLRVCRPEQALPLDMGAGTVHEANARLQENAALTERQRPWLQNHDLALSLVLHLERHRMDATFFAQIAWLRYLRCKVRLALTWQAWNDAIESLEAQVALSDSTSPETLDASSASVPAPSGGAPQNIGQPTRCSTSLELPGLTDTAIWRRCEAYLAEIHTIEAEMERLKQSW